MIYNLTQIFVNQLFLKDISNHISQLHVTTLLQITAVCKPTITSPHERYTFASTKILHSQVSRQSAHEGGKVVSPTHPPPLPPGYIPGTHFC